MKASHNLSIYKIVPSIRGAETEEWFTLITLRDIVVRTNIKCRFYNNAVLQSEYVYLTQCVIC